MRFRTLSRTSLMKVYIKGQEQLVVPERVQPGLLSDYVLPFTVLGMANWMIRTMTPLNGSNLVLGIKILFEHPFDMSSSNHKKDVQFITTRTPHIMLMIRISYRIPRNFHSFAHALFSLLCTHEIQKWQCFTTRCSTLNHPHRKKIFIIHLGL